MFALIWIVLVSIVTNGALVVSAEEKSPKFIIVGAGASGYAAATKLLDNGYHNIVLLEAENRIGGRVYSIPFGKGYIDLGGQWCQGEAGNVVYEMVKNDFELGDNAIRHDNSLCHTSDGQLVDNGKYVKLMDVSAAILNDFEGMAKFNKSLGEFFDVNYRKALQDQKFEDVDEELVRQIEEFSHKGMNTLYASESWYDISTRLSGVEGAEGNQQMTWKEHGFKTVFDFLSKKRPDPSKALPVDDKIHLNKEVTNIDWTSNEVVVVCADGSEYRADHVIVTVSLGYLKKHHRTLFTPQLPDKKINAIEHTGYGTLGKIFLEFEEPFWPAKDWGSYVFLWKQEDIDNVTGTQKEWITQLTAFIREDAQPNLIGGLLAGKHIKEFEEISDNQLIDDCMWLLEKFLGRTLPRPINMRRNRWMTSEHFLGSYSYATMDTQAHNVVLGKDLGETLYGSDNKPILLTAGEATEENYSGYVHGAVASGWRAANEILDYYASLQQN